MKQKIGKKCKGIRMYGNRSFSAAIVCLIAIGYGGYLMWRGMSGHVRRGDFTGEAIIPRWVHVVGGALLIFSSTAALAFMLWHLQSF